MPSWVSKDGVWKPAQESAVIHTKGTEANPNGEPLIDEKGGAEKSSLLTGALVAFGRRVFFSGDVSFGSR